MGHNTCKSIGAVLCVVRRYLKCPSLETIFQAHSEFFAPR